MKLSLPARRKPDTAADTADTATGTVDTEVVSEETSARSSTKSERRRVRRVRMANARTGEAAELIEVEIEVAEERPEPEPEAAGSPAAAAAAAAASVVAAGGTPEEAARAAEEAAAAAEEAAAVRAAEEARAADEDEKQRRRVRWALYNASAAGAGHLLIWGVTGDPLAATHFMGRMTVSVPELLAGGLTLGGLVAGWHGIKLTYLHKVPMIGWAVRPAAAIGASMWGQGSAPLLRDVMAATEPWSSLFAPLLAVGPLAVACWYGLDRRAAQARLIRPVRWLARIPLATVTVASLIYAPGAVL